MTSFEETALEFIDKGIHKLGIPSKDLSALEVAGIEKMLGITEEQLIASGIWRKPLNDAVKVADVAIVAAAEVGVAELPQPFQPLAQFVVGEIPAAVQTVANDIENS